MNVLFKKKIDLNKTVFIIVSAIKIVGISNGTVFIGRNYIFVFFKDSNYRAENS